jgi:hypothetical protein
VNRIAERLRCRITASGHHRLMLAGFLRFPIAGNGVAACQEEELYEVRSWAGYLLAAMRQHRIAGSLIACRYGAC